MGRTFGKLLWAEADPTRDAPHGAWGLSLDPHVAIRARRVFAKAEQNRSGVIILRHSADVVRDIAWLNDRYPLEADDAVWDRLHTAVADATRTEEVVEQILAGGRLPVDGARTAAQPTREYQQPVVDMVTAVRRLLVTDALGLGKTHEGALTFRNPDALPGVVVTLTHLQDQWRRQLETIWPELHVHVLRKGTVYELPWGGNPDIVVLNYSKLQGWSQHLAGWASAVVFDEVQDLRTGVGTAKGAAAAWISKTATYSVGLTATPVYNYGGELHSIVDILNPGALGSREEFLREWGGRSWTTSTGQAHATVADPQALSQYMRGTGLMIGRTRAEVGRTLPFGEPEKIAHVVPADESVLERMAGDAVEMAKMILGQTGTNRDRFQASGELDMRLRQATGIAKAPVVAKFVESILESEERVVLWGWHHAVYDLWKERLKAYGVVTYTGNETTGQKIAAETAFTTGTARVLIMSLRSGAGLDGLQNVCNVGIFGELDWSPKVHDQCLGRLARDGQENQVVGYYLMADSGADPTIVERLGLKEAQARPIEDPTADITAPIPVDDTSRIRALAEAILRQHGIDPEAGAA
jgi:hypothetical protein